MGPLRTACMLLVASACFACAPADESEGTSPAFTAKAENQPNTPEQQTMIDKIEALIELPEGARPIEDYSRNYMARPDGKVVGAFTLPSPEIREDVECSVMQEDFGTRPCSDEELAELRQTEDAARASIAAVGSSRWIDDPDDFPYVLDGGCGYITVVYDTASEQVESVACNGVA